MKIFIHLSAATLLLLSALGAFAQGSAPTLTVVQTFTVADGAAYLLCHAINRQGDIVGTRFTERDEELGFLRRRNGKEISLKYPGVYETAASGINDGETICGSYIGDDSQSHGWFRQDGTYTSFDLPGESDTVIQGINNAGDFVGKAIDPQRSLFAYVDIGGVVTQINLADATNTEPEAISSTGWVTGFYELPSNGGTFGFLRRPDGSFIKNISAPGGSVATYCEGVNNRGYVVGYYQKGSHNYGFLFRPPSTYVPFSVPGADNTFLFGINNRGQIAGSYSTAGVPHGIVVQLNE